jgi:hypothetical protein
MKGKTMDKETIVELITFGIPSVFMLIFLVMLIEEDVHNFGISERIADALDSIHKKKGNR